jgi:two-component system alkaline phosphatase synthesis response regulator PhoP
MRKKVLLVDDSASTLMMEEMILKHLTPYQCITAMDGLDALALALAESPDLVLMDAVMPRMNGFEACQTMRRERALSEIPIILVTTSEEEEFMEAGFQSGCSDYITKPIDSRKLLSMLRVYLEGKKTPAIRLRMHGGSTEQ